MQNSREERCSGAGVLVVELLHAGRAAPMSAGIWELDLSHTQTSGPGVRL